MSIQWHALKPNDKVRIVAPSARTANAWEDLEKCCEYLRALQLEPVYSDTIFCDDLNSYYEFSNTDDARYEDFVNALHSDANAIWCFRGGYGCDRVIASLIKNNIKPKEMKIFLGFSDITNLHSYITQVWDWSTLHVSALKQFPLKQINSENEKMTLDILFGKVKEINVPLVPLNNAATQNKSIHAEIIGGNLTTLQCALGTPWQTNSKDKFLLLEDVGESAYRVARMLFQFLHNGYLDNVAGVLLGDFIPVLKIDQLIETPDAPLTEVINHFAASCDVPVFRIEGVGHSPKNFPLPLHTKAYIENSALIAKTGAA